MFRRSFGLGGQRGALNRPLIQELSQANQLYADGHPDQAAMALADLAGKLETRGFPRRAANVHALAARAWIQARNQAQALNQARIALNQFKQLSMERRAASFYQNVTRAMLEGGLKDGADQVKHEFGAHIDMTGVAAAGSQGRGRLPATCPQCGAPIRSDEVNWIDDTSASSPFCGTVLQTSA